MKAIFSLLVLFLSVFLLSCSNNDSSSTDEPTRSFAMGFTPWPYEASVAAINFTYDQIASQGDIIAHHLDGGIPWQEALDQTPYPAEVEAELSLRVDNTPDEALVYLAISPFNGARDDIAGYWSAGTQEPLPAAWESRDFDSAELIQAYLNFAEDLIERFDPDYFNLGIEASELAINDSAKFGKFVIFVEQVSASLKLNHPDLPLMISVALKSPGSTEAATIEAEVPSIIQFIDLVGVSIYPYVFFSHGDKGDPANLPADWLSQIERLSGDKPIAIAETGWIAQPLEIAAFSVDVDATEANQDAYLTALLQQAESLQAEFIIWFFLVDFDTLWNDSLGQDPVAQIWRDTGLYDENLNPRLSLSTWNAALQLEKSQ